MFVQWHRPAVIQGGPPEHPADDLEVLFKALFVGEVFVRVFVGVVAAHAQAAAGAVVEVFDAEHAVVFDGVDFTVGDLAAASVDGEGGALLDDVGHAVVDHVGAYRAVGVYVEGFEGVQGDADALGRGERGVEGDLHVDFFRETDGAREVLAAFFAGGDAFPWVRAFQQEVGRWVFEAFAGAQPTAGDAEQFCDLVESAHGHAALEPVVHVLRRDTTVLGEVGGGKMNFPQ